MSEYEAYEGQSIRSEEGSPTEPLGNTADQYYDETGMPEVLARVPDLQASPLEPTETVGMTSHGRRRSSSFSTRSLLTIGAMMFVVGLGGFMLGRAGRPEAAEENDLFDPPPSAATASEAPSWKPGNLTATEVQQASPRSDGSQPRQPPDVHHQSACSGGSRARLDSRAGQRKRETESSELGWDPRGAGSVAGRRHARHHHADANALELSR